MHARTGAGSRETGQDDLRCVIGQGDRCVTADVGSGAAQQCAQAHSGLLDTTLSQGHRAHPQLDDPARAGVGRWVSRTGAAGQ